MSFRFSSKTGVVSLVAALIVALGMFAVNGSRSTEAVPVGNPIVVNCTTGALITTVSSGTQVCVDQLFDEVGVLTNNSASISSGVTGGAAASALLLVRATESTNPAGSQDVTAQLPDTAAAANTYTASVGQLTTLPAGTGVTIRVTTTITCATAAGTVTFTGTQAVANAGTTINCTTPATGNITIWKMNQNGHPVGPATFVVEQETPAGSGNWNPVATFFTGANGVNGGHPSPNGCSTSQGIAGFTPPAAPLPFNVWGTIPNTVCTAAGTFVTGPAFTPVGPLPIGNYRAREVVAPPIGCHFSEWALGTPATVLPGAFFGPGGNIWSGFTGSSLPINFVLTGAGIDLTAVNSCDIPAGPSATGSQLVVVIGGTSQGLTNTANVEIAPAPGSDDDARIDIRIRDSNQTPIPNAHVTVTVDKGRIAGRLDCSSGSCSGVDVIEPNPPNFGTNRFGDTCDYVLAQSQATGSVAAPYLIAGNFVSASVQDVYTNANGIVSLCYFAGDDLVSGITPGVATITAIVEMPSAYNLYNPLSSANVILTAKITVVGPPASITVAASPSTLNCGEKSTITVTVKDAANQNVSDHTRVEAVTNFGGVLGGTGGTLGFPGTGPVNPVSSAAAETFNGTATMFLLTSTEHVGPYEVVVTSGGSTGGNLAQVLTPLSAGLLAGITSSNYLGNANNPAYNIVPGQPVSVNSLTPIFNVYGGSGVFSTPPVSSQVTVNCSVPAAAAPVVAPVIQAPRTGEGPTIRPPNTGDAGLVVD